MVNTLFRGMLIASSAYYGDSIGLAPVALARAGYNEEILDQHFWEKECHSNPCQIACRDYEC